MRIAEVAMKGKLPMEFPPSPPDAPPVVKVPTRVEWENEAVDIFIDDDEEAMLMTAQDGVRE